MRYGLTHLLRRCKRKKDRELKNFTALERKFTYKGIKILICTVIWISTAFKKGNLSDYCFTVEKEALWKTRNSLSPGIMSSMVFCFKWEPGNLS